MRQNKIDLFGDKIDQRGETLQENQNWPVFFFFSEYNLSRLVWLFNV